MDINEIFIKLFNMSITASYVILIIMAVRIPLKKFPKKYSYALWSIAGLRLVFPFSLKSVFSLFNLSFFTDINIGNSGPEYIPLNIGYANTPAVNTGIVPINNAVNSLMPAAEVYNSVNPMQIWIAAAVFIWISGIVLILGYEAFLLFRTKKLVKQAVLYKENIYECNNIPTPFVIGLIKPKIYIPFRLNKAKLSYILYHEKYHIKRHDNLIKSIAFLLAAVYWFNPFIWAAYFCMIRDMEMSCDEKVISEMGNSIIKDYSTSLLSFASNRRRLPLGPLAFGESAAGKRIKNILSFKTPKMWISAAGVLTIIIIGAVCLTNGEKTVNANDYDTFIADNIKTWANAFCGRDGKTIAKMASPECLADMNLSVEFDTEYNSFGWSSPWPFFGLAELSMEESVIEEKPAKKTDEERYNIVIHPDNASADIFYYALVSDPHVFVWKETLTFEIKNDNFIMTSEKIDFLDSISSKEDFFKAYPYEITEDSQMNYTTNGLGEILNNNAKSEYQLYRELFNPKTALLSILNIQSEAVETETITENNKCYVIIKFKENTDKIKVLMTQPYGKDGVWLPQKYSQIT